MTANTFDLLRARPILGRDYVEGEDAPGATLVAIGEEATVIGVMDEGFLFPFREHIWVPDRRRSLDLERGDPDTPTPRVFGRLAPGISVDQANAEMNTIAARIAQAHPETNENRSVNVHPFTEAFTLAAPVRRAVAAVDACGPEPPRSWSTSGRISPGETGGKPVP